MNPTQGDSAWLGPAPNKVAPALDGRYGSRLLLMDAGSSAVSWGITKNAPTNAEIAAAVLRSSAPSASPIIPVTVTYNAAPTTDRSAPGAVIATFRWWLASRVCPMENEITAAISDSVSTTPAKTPSLPHSTGKRRGTAVSDARIMPVLYSPLISNTPSTPIASCARVKPARLVATGLNVARSLALNVWYSSATTEENNALTPIINATAMSSVQTVERTDRNFVHSERR